MAIYRKGEGLWSRGASAAILFATALFGCRRLADALAGFGWGRSELLHTRLGVLTSGWVAAGALLAACGAGLWTLMNHAKAVDFLVDMEQELRKVSWPVDRTRVDFSGRYRELTQSSLIVISSVLVLAATLFFYDLLLGAFIRVVLGA